MKNFPFLPLIAVFVFSGCCKKQDTQDSGIPACIEEKLESFKQLPYAQKLLKIDRPAGTLYWFVDSYADGGEDVVDADCNLVCLMDCECDPGAVVLCDDTHLDFPSEVLWEQ